MSAGDHLQIIGDPIGAVVVNVLTSQTHTDKLRAKLLKVQSALPRSIWKSAVIGLRFFPLKSADVRGAGTRDEPLRTSAWEAKALVLSAILNTWLPRSNFIYSINTLLTAGSCKSELRYLRH